MLTFRAHICQSGTMSLAHALLTALLERGCSGSELALRFDRSIGYFWPASHQQIYRELARMEDAGWVKSTPAESGPGRKRNYEVLAAGRRELRQWVADARAPKAIRDELLVKLRAAAVLDDADLIGTLELRLGTHRGKLATYREIERRAFAQPNPTREDRLRRLILQAGIDLEELWIRLCREAIEIVGEKHAAGSADAGELPKVGDGG